MGAAGGRLRVVRVLLPAGNRAQLSDSREDVVEKLKVIVYGDVDRSRAKAVEV